MNGSKIVLLGLFLFSCLLIFTSVDAKETTLSKYSIVDIQNLLNGKKQHAQQVESALMEINILADACNIYGKQSPLYSTYSSEKSTSLKDFNELRKSLQYEIENLQQFLKEKTVKDDSEAKMIAEKKAKEEAERIANEKKVKEEAERMINEKKQKAEAEAKLEAEKKAKEAEQKVSIGDLTSSTILKESESKKLVSELLKDVKKRPITLCYRASQGGFDPVAFNFKCDNKGATITIIKSSSGAVFGGYVSISWNAEIRGYTSDPSSFLFSIHGPTTKGRYKKFKNNGGNAIYSANNVHPTFGNGHDIYIQQGNNNSYHNPTSSSFPCTESECLEVRHPTYFTTLDYEVYTL